jgi:hypothetical protein
MPPCTLTKAGFFKVLGLDRGVDILSKDRYNLNNVLGYCRAYIDVSQHLHTPSDSINALEMRPSRSSFARDQPISCVQLD